MDEIQGRAEKWGRLQDAYDAANSELVAVMREIEDSYTMENHNPVHNRFLRADHEAIVTVEKPSTVRTVPDDFIYIAMDRCQVVVKFLWPEGIQCLYDEKVPETVARQLTTYFSIEPPPVPDKAQPPERLCAPLGPPLADSPGRQNLSLVNCSYSTYVDVSSRRLWGSMQSSASGLEPETSSSGKSTRHFTKTLERRGNLVTLTGETTAPS